MSTLMHRKIGKTINILNSSLFNMSQAKFRLFLFMCTQVITKGECKHNTRHFFSAEKSTKNSLFFNMNILKCDEKLHVAFDFWYPSESLGVVAIHRNIIWFSQNAHSHKQYLFLSRFNSKQVCNYSFLWAKSGVGQNLRTSQRLVKTESRKVERSFSILTVRFPWFNWNKRSGLP